MLRRHEFLLWLSKSVTLSSTKKLYCTVIFLSMEQHKKKLLMGGNTGTGVGGYPYVEVVHDYSIQEKDFSKQQAEAAWANSVGRPQSTRISSVYWHTCAVPAR